MRDRSIGNRRLALGERLELVLQGATQMEIVRRAGHKAGLGEPLQGVRDRGSLRRHELAKQTVRERQR